MLGVEGEPADVRERPSDSPPFRESWGGKDVSETQLQLHPKAHSLSKRWPPKIFVHFPEPVRVTLFGKRLYADVIKSRVS